MLQIVDLQLSRMQKECFSQVCVDLAQLILELGLTLDPVIDGYINFVLQKLEVTFVVVFAPAGYPTPINTIKLFWASLTFMIQKCFYNWGSLRNMFLVGVN